MECLHSMAPNDEELLSFALDGEPLPEGAREHLEQCKTCQQRLTVYKKTNDFLLSHLYRSQCPNSTHLSFYCANLLSGDDRVSIAAHIQDCPLCAAEAEQTRRFIAVMDPLPAPAFSPRAAVRRIFGTLVRQQAQLVLRGNGVSETAWPRQYRAESLDLSLHLSRASNGEYILLGILTSTNSSESVDAFEGVGAELYREGNRGDKQIEAPLLSTKVDDLGNIVFSPVPVGNYVLIIHLPGRELVIEGLSIEQG